jgi:branched-subunit amino acid aminotransferase/4-amino-4-deoxychorismate lyase
MNIPKYTLQDLVSNIDRLRRPWHENYLSMFSSVFDGIVTDPVLMTLPVDDHIVHRGDGVFDVFKAVDGRAFCMNEHLDRLERSAKGIDLKLPVPRERLVDIIRATAKAGGQQNIMIRVMVSRGPGGFTTNPYECPASQLYVVITRLKTLPAEAYDQGVRIISVPVPIKPPPYANIKSCDYLTNVMIKKAAVEADVQFAVTWTTDGHLAEGSTENVFLVSPDRELLVPNFNHVLKGVTLTRVMALAEILVEEGVLTGIRNADIDRDLAKRSQEVMVCGTTLDVVPVTNWDGRQIGNGLPGPAARRLLELLRHDLRYNETLLTPLMD